MRKSRKVLQSPIWRSWTSFLIKKFVCFKNLRISFIGKINNLNFGIRSQIWKSLTQVTELSAATTTSLLFSGWFLAIKLKNKCKSRSKIQEVLHGSQLISKTTVQADRLYQLDRTLLIRVLIVGTQTVLQPLHNCFPYFTLRKINWSNRTKITKPWCMK